MDNQPIKNDSDQQKAEVPDYPEPPVYNNKQSDTSIYIILGFVFAGLGFLCCPIIFSVAGIVFGIIAYSKGDKLGVWVIVASVVSLIAGAAIGFYYTNKMFQSGGFPTLPPSSGPTPPPPSR